MSDRLLPPNATAQEIALEAATAYRVESIPLPITSMIVAETCPQIVIPWLAWAASVDKWDSTWSIEQKRSAVAASLGVHKKKGTIGAVKSALSAIGYSVQVQEWFNQSPPGLAYTVRMIVNVDQHGIDQAGMAFVISVVNSAKNLRTHISEVVPAINTQSYLVIGGIPVVGSNVTVSNFVAAQLAITENAVRM